MARKDGFETRTLNVALAPELLTAVVREGGRIASWSEIRIDADGGEGHWRAALAAFSDWIANAGVGMRGVPLTLSLSTRWCQLAMLPWSDALLYTDSAQRYQQERFVQIYGSAALEWEIVSDDAARGQARLGCAIERRFAHGLWAAAQGAGYARVNIESLLAAAARAIPPTPCDRFAILEPGRAVLAARRYGRVAGVQAQACAGVWPAGLPTAWEHWRMRAPEVGDVAKVVLFAPEGSGAGLPEQGALALDAPTWHTGGQPTHFARSPHAQPEDLPAAGPVRVAAERTDGPGAAASGR